MIRHETFERLSKEAHEAFCKELGELCAKHRVWLEGTSRGIDVMLSEEPGCETPVNRDEV